MDRLTRFLTAFGVLIGGIFLIGASIVITLEVLLRKFAGISIESLHEISGFAMAVAFAWAMPFTILTRGHIRVDLLYSKLSARTRLGVDIFAGVAFAAYMVMLVLRCCDLTISSFDAGTLSSGLVSVPLVIPQAIWTAGLAVAALVLIFALLNAAVALMGGRAAEAAAALAPYRDDGISSVGDDRLSQQDDPR